MSNDPTIDHPQIYATDEGDIVVTILGHPAVLMDLSLGSSYYQLGMSPQGDDLKRIVGQCSRIHRLRIRERPLPDEWSVASLATNLRRADKFIPRTLKPTIESIVRRYESFGIGSLPHCFIHGDITSTNVLKLEDRSIQIIDYSVSGTYPRIQELAVMAANLMQEDPRDCDDRASTLVSEYTRENHLTGTEMDAMPIFTHAAVATSYLAALALQATSAKNSEETSYWVEVGRRDLVMLADR